MRLIDADKLHYHRELIDKLDCGISPAVVVYAKEIDKAPIINAIPIEWIKNEARKAMTAGHRYNHDYGLVYTACLDQLLENWEKENEYTSGV